MSVREINEVHHDYIELFERAKSAWTYHQFLRGVGHVFVEERPVGEVDVDFQPLFAELKEVSENLNSASIPRVRDRLDGVTAELANIVATLDEEDSKLSPSFLRQFFHRVKSYDEQVVIRMTRFYLSVQGGRKWPGDRIDKVDFLASTLAELICGPEMKRQRAKLLPLLEKFWSIASEEALPPGVLEACQARLEAFDEEIEGLTSLAQQRESNLLGRYREFKHSLGRAYFYPQLLEGVLRTNLRLRAAIRQFYSHEERRLFSEYEQLADLERTVTVDPQLGREVSEVHRDVEAFEQRVQQHNVRLADLEEVRSRVSALLPEIQRRGESIVPHSAVVESSDDVVPSALAGALDKMPAWLSAERNAEFIGVIHKIAAVDDTVEADEAVHLPELAPYDLEPREVIAFRRLREEGEVGRPTDVLVLAAAAVRRRLERDADEVRDLPLDEPVEEGSQGILRVREALGLAERQMAELVEAGERSEPEEAAELAKSRVRLMRAYADIWLLTYPLSAVPEE